MACSLPGALSFADPGDEGTVGQYGSEVLLTECCGGACTDLDFDSANCGAE
jgi:hypothetical protein